MYFQLNDDQQTSVSAESDVHPRQVGQLIEPEGVDALLAGGNVVADELEELVDDSPKGFLKIQMTQESEQLRLLDGQGRCVRVRTTNLLPPESRKQ